MDDKCCSCPKESEGLGSDFVSWSEEEEKKKIKKLKSTMTPQKYKLLKLNKEFLVVLLHYLQ